MMALEQFRFQRLEVNLLQGLGTEQFFDLRRDLTLQTCGDGVF
jgi:hypothetical protein